MAKPYTVGQIVGIVEVIAYLGRRTNVRRQYESVYRVRCTSCGKLQDLTSYDMRSKYACECQKTDVNGFAKKYARSRSILAPKTDPTDRLWMSDEEIRRHYRELANKAEGVTILAELNDVSEAEIRRILRKGK